MCGIAGEARFDQRPDEDAVRRMTEAIRHRGPDADGFHFVDQVALGHRRLSILDLVGGGQPMARDGCIIVFNGEAYHHQVLRQELAERGHTFGTRSDTEVVLAAYLEWGESFIERVHGMFALALWDQRSERLLLARDRLGKKPLYYALRRGSGWQIDPPDGEALLEGITGLIFGSELKALAAHRAVPSQLDPQALVQYLGVEYVPAPRSIRRGVFKLPAAHLAILDRRGLRLRRYWELPELPRPGEVVPSPGEAATELLRRLDGAVARRLMADVPVGVFLSGGVDSTAVAALAARHHRPLHTFSIGFEEATFDESHWARLAARHVGSEHHEQRLSGHACLDLVPEVGSVLDEPFADASILPTLLLSRFVRDSVTVALAGDGGDELFAGYDTFLAHRPADWASRLPHPLLTAVGALARCLPASSRNMSFDFRLKQFLRGLEGPPSLRHQRWIGSFMPEEMASVVVSELRPLATVETVYREVLQDAARAQRAGAAAGSIDEALRFFLTRYLADDILVKADRASMAASLEVRAPFLETEVVELVLRLPARYKLGLASTKRLLKQALRGLVPAEILARPKKGFGIPMAAWIRGPLRPLFEDLFSRQSLERTGVLDPAASRTLLDRHLSGAADLRKPLWTLAAFMLWQRRWG